MKNIRLNILAALALFLLGSCTDVIEVETDPADTLLVVDAWISNETKPQTIRLTETQPYFDSQVSTGVTGATVTVESSEGKTFEFIGQGDGLYIWTPTTDGEIGEIGTGYRLTVDYNSEIYIGETNLGDVPPVDSITQEYREDDFTTDGIYAEFFARDLIGIGNTYWIKTFKNGVFLNKPFEMNLAYDAAFSGGGEVDGLIFIPPIRETVNRISDIDDPDDGESPWAPGDIIRVEIHSISIDAFDFLSLAQEQMTNGDNTIFATPLANTSSNILNTSDGNDALGIFNVAAVSSLEQEIL